MKIYLSGGFQSGWQDEVVRAAPRHVYFDPRNNDTNVPAEYTFLDLAHIQQCDLVLAYLESTNPSGLGLALEMGYAKGLGKLVIFVTDGRKYAVILAESADTTLDSLEEAIDLIRRLRCCTVVKQ